MHRFVDYKPGIPGWVGISGVLLCVLFSSTIYAQSIVTYGGNGTFGFSGDGGPASDANLADPSGVLLIL